MNSAATPPKVTGGGHDEALEYIRQRVLATDERIMWNGRPGLKASASSELDRAAIGIAVIVFAVFWMAIGVHVQGFFSVFGLAGVALLAVGGWLARAPLGSCLRAARTCYAITDRRVLIVTMGRQRTVHIIRRKDIDAYKRTDLPGGKGSIQLTSTMQPPGGVRHGRFTLAFSSSRHVGTLAATVPTVSFLDGLWDIADVEGAARAVAALRED